MNVLAFEAKHSVGFGVSQPYLINPDKHISDTNILLSYKNQFHEKFFFNANMMQGLAGRYSFRNQYGVGINLSTSSVFTPFVSFNLLHEWNPEVNFGISPRIGAEVDLSGIFNRYFFFLRFDLGWNFLLIEPTRNEFDLFRTSIGFRF